MATAFTHAFVGAALAHAAPARLRSPRLLVAAAGLAVLPDLDVAAFALGIPYGDPLGHRGLSHSLAFAALSGPLCAWLVFSTPARLSRSWWQVAALLALATATHGVLDAATDAGLGVGLLSPFDDRRYFWPWRPLATSPIGLGAFFEARSLAILWNELLWVWLPAAAALAVLHARRRARAAGSA